MSTLPSPLRRTPTADRELAARRTAPILRADVWRLLLDEWLPRWLDIDAVPLMVGTAVRRDDEVRGRVSGCYVGRRVRVRWEDPALGHATLFQVTLTEDEGGTEIVIQEEGLAGTAERDARRVRWTAALDAALAQVDGEHRERRSADPLS
ncbi:SRPBCC family protein [Brachybacterium sp. AOP25-B2-12]|uniref:SRPBCC family protein n=1 Tax=Brachybacterium sp. AOP25-B2-12 TaxID=3457710 RepID=UPI004034A3D6